MAAGNIGIGIGGGGGRTSKPTPTLAIGLFVATGYYFSRLLKRKRRRGTHYGGQYDDEASAQQPKQLGAASLDPDTLATLGSRGRTAALIPTLPHWSAFLRCLQDPCDPLLNPEGWIALCLSENKLVQEMLATRLMVQGTAITAFSDSIVYGYNGFLGLPQAREAVAYFLERRFLLAGGDGGWSPPPHDAEMHAAVAEEEAYRTGSADNTDGGDDGQSPQFRPSSPGLDPDRIDPEHVALGAGLGSLLSSLLYILAEREDAVLIPAPYYTSFENDLKAIAGCMPYPVYMDNARNGPTTDELEKAAKLAERDGLRVKMLLLTNPHDPLGVIYRPQTLRNCISWARSRQMHTVVDEIYALSVHKTEGHGFESVIRIMNNKLGDDVHMLWSFSKDFGASGFRIGIVYTQNTLLLVALANLNIFSGVSHPMQLIAAEILTDDVFVDSFLADARAMLTWSYTICVRKLEEMVVPYVQAEAGLCVYVDFSSLLPEQSFEGERKFANVVQDAARVVMTPGECQRDRKPGMFRICYAWVSPEVLEIALERLSYLVTKVRRYHWDDLDASVLKDVAKAGMLMGLRRTPSVNLVDLTHTNGAR